MIICWKMSLIKGCWTCKVTESRLQTIGMTPDLLNSNLNINLLKKGRIQFNNKISTCLPFNNASSTRQVPKWCQLNTHLKQQSNKLGVQIVKKDRVLVTEPLLYSHNWWLFRIVEHKHNCKKTFIHLKPKTPCKWIFNKNLALVQSWQEWLFKDLECKDKRTFSPINQFWCNNSTSQELQGHMANKWSMQQNYLI